MQRKYVQTHHPAANTLQEQAGRLLPLGGTLPVSTRAPGAPQGVGGVMGQHWFSDRGPSLGLWGAPRAELSQRLESACRWRHPGVRGGPGAPAWGWRDDLRGACPGGPLKRHSGDQRGLRAAGSTPASHWLQASPWAGSGGMDGPHSPCPTKAEEPPLQEGWSPGAAPLPPAAGVCGDAEHRSRGFSHHQAGAVGGSVV